MFWNIDVKEQEQDLMAVSHFPERRLAGFRTGEWSLVLQAL